jgi:hypothetical protein
VPVGFAPRASRDLARVGLRLAPQRRSGRGFAAAVIVAAAAFAAGYGAAELPRALVTAPAAPATPPGSSVGTQQLRLQLEQARMGLRVADSRGQELERQIDALNQKLTESQDELTFIRKAREGQKH